MISISHFASMEKYNVGNWRWTLAEVISQGELVYVCEFLSVNLYGGWRGGMQPEWELLQESLWKCINITPTIMSHIQPICLHQQAEREGTLSHNPTQVHKHLWLRLYAAIRSLSSWEHTSPISICSCSHLSLTLSPSPNHSTSQGIGVALKNSRFVRCSRAVDIHGKTHPPALISQLTTLHAPCQPISFET